MDQLWQFFFKYKWAAFVKGQFSFINRPSFVLILIFLLFAGALIYFLYLRPGMQGHRLTSKWQGGLVALRVAVLALLALLLMRPVVVVPSVIPKSNASSART